MEIKTIVTVIIAGMLGAVVFAGLLPVFADTSSSDTTFKNEGLYYMENPTDTVSVKFLGNTDWEIDGEPLIYTPNGATNIIVTESIFIRNVGQVRGGLYQTWQSADLTISGGTITGTAMVSGVETSINYPYDWIYVATNEDSPNIMTDPAKDTYIVEDSVIIGRGITAIKDSDGNNQFVNFSVDVENMTATVSTTISAVSISDVVLNTEEVNGYNGLYKFTSVTFDAKWGDYVTPVTYSIVIAPSEVTAEKTIHPDGPTAALLNLLPVLIAIGLIVGIAGAIFVKRM